jgi:hypothetical protein
MIKPQDPEGPNRAAWARNLALFTVIVTDLIAYTGAGIGLGYLAWAKLNAPWWVLLLSSILGLILAFYRLYQVSQKKWEN